VVLIIVLGVSLVIATKWRNDPFLAGLSSSLIGVVLAFAIAYFFLERYRLERERKERKRRVEIQKDILSQMSEILGILVIEYATEINNFLRNPVDLYGEERGDFDQFMGLIEDGVFKMPDQVEKVDFLSMEYFINIMSSAARRLTREMELHPAVLDEIRGVTRSFNQFRENLDRCAARINQNTQLESSGKKVDENVAVDSLLWLGRSMIKVLRAVNHVSNELALAERRPESP